MPIPSSLIPSRFLTLMAHLVIVIDIFWSRENNVLASLPPTHTSLQYQNRDTELIVALSVTLGMFLIELLGFFSGVSMFNSTQSLISIGTHASASVTLLFFLFEQWPCSTYWWIFAFCSVAFTTSMWNAMVLAMVSLLPSLCITRSALPACIEIILMIGVFGLKKKPL